MRTTALLVLGLGVCHATAKCLNVDVGAAEGGEKTCFTGDAVGMVCGWDETAEEAYCTADAGGVMVCARAEKGGKCAAAELPPANAYTAKQQKAKAVMQAAEDAQHADTGSDDADGGPAASHAADAEGTAEEHAADEEHGDAAGGHGEEYDDSQHLAELKEALASGDITQEEHDEMRQYHDEM